MTGVQNRGNIENINKYIKLAPLLLPGEKGYKNIIIRILSPSPHGRGI